jgi:hypothetical protein
VPQKERKINAGEVGDAQIEPEQASAVVKRSGLAIVQK